MSRTACANASHVKLADRVPPAGGAYARAGPSSAFTVVDAGHAPRSMNSAIAFVSRPKTSAAESAYPFRFWNVMSLLRRTSELDQLRLREAARQRRVGIDRQQLGRGHEADTGLRLDEADERVEVGEGALGFRGRPRARQPPLGARRVGAAAEIHRVPELGLDPFVGVVVDADRPAAALAQIRRTPW